MAKISGDPSLSAVELTVQNYYFGFQVVQVFLVATVGSAASSSVKAIIKTPTSVPSLLASSIPKASNFYLSYIILQGLAVVSNLLLGLSGLAVFIILGKLLDKTPRKMYKRWISLSSLGWGTVFPIYTNLLVIGKSTFSFFLKHAMADILLPLASKSKTTKACLYKANTTQQSVMHALLLSSSCLRP